METVNIQKIWKICSWFQDFCVENPRFLDLWNTNLYLKYTSTKMQLISRFLGRPRFWATPENFQSTPDVPKTGNTKPLPWGVDMSFCISKHLLDIMYVNHFVYNYHDVNHHFLYHNDDVILMIIITGWWFQPLWKILVNGNDYPIYYGKIKIMFQTTNQFINPMRVNLHFRMVFLWVFLWFSNQ